MNASITVGAPAQKLDAELPRYEAPRIQAMSEKDILSSFQITQSMGAWWNIASC